MVGALFTNVTIKPLVARVRPYEHETYRAFWEFVGASVESERSFPSGHTTTAFAAMGAIFLVWRKKYSWPALVFAALVGMTRLYLVVHYPTDVLGGIVVGAASALISYALLRLAFSALERHDAHPVCNALLNFDLILLVRRLLGKKSDSPEES